MGGKYTLSKRGDDKLWVINLRKTIVFYHIYIYICMWIPYKRRRRKNIRYMIKGRFRESLYTTLFINFTKIIVHNLTFLTTYQR